MNLKLPKSAFRELEISPKVRFVNFLGSDDNICSLVFLYHYSIICISIFQYYCINYSRASIYINWVNEHIIVNSNIINEYILKLLPENINLREQEKRRAGNQFRKSQGYFFFLGYFVKICWVYWKVKSFCNI